MNPFLSHNWKWVLDMVETTVRNGREYLSDLEEGLLQGHPEMQHMFNRLVEEELRKGRDFIPSGLRRPVDLSPPGPRGEGRLPR